MAERISGSKMMSRSGASPRSNTAPRPAPTWANTTLPGMMPRKVPRDVCARAHAEESGHQVDQPEGKQRDQAQDQEIAEGIVLKAGLHLLEQGSRGLAAQHVGECGARGHEEDGGAQGGPHDHVDRRRHGTEEEAPRHGQGRPNRQGERDRGHVEEDEGQRRQHPAPVHPIHERRPVFAQDREIDIVVQAGGVESHQAEGEDCERQQSSERRGIAHRSIGAHVDPVCSHHVFGRRRRQKGVEAVCIIAPPTQPVTLP